MTNFVILLKKNLLEMVRNKRIIIFSTVFIALSIISALSAKYLPLLFDLLVEELETITGAGVMFLMEANVNDSYAQLITNFGEVALLLIGVMFATTIIKDKNKGTYTSLKMNGVKDSEIVLSHFVSQTILITLSYLASVMVFTLLNIILFNQIMGVRGIVSLTYVYLLMLFMICFSLFSSCLCKKNGKSYLLVVLGYFALFFLDVIPKINKFNPFHLLTLSTNLMYYESYNLSEHLVTVLASVVFCFALIALSLVLVKNRINNKKVNSYDRG